MKIGNNEPCPCGKIDKAGKPIKYKKCCRDKIPRTQAVYFGANEQFNGIFFKDGKVFAHLLSGKKEEMTFFSQKSYDRVSGKQKLIWNIANEIVLDPSLLSFLTQFDEFFVIDTNTDPDLKLSMACVLRIIEIKNIGNGHINISREMGLISFKNCEPTQEENFGWKKLIELIL